MSVYRRFSDFLGLHEKLVEKHQARGMIVPPAPEKSIVGTWRKHMYHLKPNMERPCKVSIMCYFKVQRKGLYY